MFRHLLRLRFLMLCIDADAMLLDTPLRLPARRFIILFHPLLRHVFF